MSFDISVTHEARQTLVVITGQAKLGQLLSLLQVLEVDSASWPHNSVLFDLQRMEGCCTHAEQSLVQSEAAVRLPRMQVITVRWPGAEGRKPLK